MKAKRGAYYILIIRTSKSITKSLISSAIFAMLYKTSILLSRFLRANFSSLSGDLLVSPPGFFHPLEALSENKKAQLEVI